MNLWITLKIAGILLVLALLVSCGPKKEPEAKAGRDAVTESAPKNSTGEIEQEEDVSFQEGKGLILSEATTQALGLKLEPVTLHELKFTIPVNVQIYREATEKFSKNGGEKSGSAYATVMLSKHEAERLNLGAKIVFDPPAGTDKPIEGTLWKLERTQASITEKVEALIEIPDQANRLFIGVFLKGLAQPEKALKSVVGVPSSAVLDTVQGKFVYIAKDGAYLRTSVKIGESSQNIVEITDGLQVGETVVVAPVEKLWLIELRLTKGGGHAE